MEEFEYGVDICDRDWTSFVAECEECNLLPPSLAGLDDSGMSDIDDKFRFVQKAELAGAFSEVDPPLCEASPADRYLGKRALTGMESILSGSEEDIHLQSVNVFFERLKSAAEAEKPAGPNQTRAPTQREVKRAGGHRGDGQRTDNGALTENIPNVNILAATSEAAVAEATEPEALPGSGARTQRKDEDGDGGVSASPAGSASESATLEPDVPEAPPSQARAPSDAATDLPAPPSVGEQEQLPPSEGFSDASQTHLDTKWMNDTNTSLSDSTDAGKTASWESSPSSSVRRKRTKKRRPEPELFIKPSDSEEEQHVRRGAFGVRVAGENRFYALKVPQRHAAAEYSTISSLPLKMSAREVNVDDLSEGRCSQSAFRQPRFNGARLTERSAVNDLSAIPLNQSVVAALNRGGRAAAPLRPHLHIDEDMIHIFCCENELRRGGRAATRSAASSPPTEGPEDPGAHSPNTKPTGVDGTAATSDGLHSLPEKRCPSPHPPVSDENIPVGSPEPPALPPSSEPGAVSGSSGVAPGIPPPLPELQTHELSPSLSEFTPVSSRCALHTEPGMALSNGTITDLSYTSCLSVSQNGSRCSGENTSLAKQEEEESSLPEADDAATVPKAAAEEEEAAPDSTHSVFAMSSFWSEMEKLTINDILGLRKMEQASSQSSLPPLQEHGKPAEFALTDSGLFSQERKPEPADVPAPSGLLSAPLPAWERADGHEDAAITGGRASDSRSGPTSFRRMCKTVSMQNLRALEPVCFRKKEQTAPSLHEEDLERVGRFPDGPVATTQDGYSISLRGIFQYIFGKQSDPQRYTGNTSPLHTEGHSLPETYDHFLSDCDAESEPLVEAEDQAKDGCRSASRTLHYPEAYEYFFASSSSDESAAESGGEDDGVPAKVAGRLRRTSTSSELPTDIYDNFFTECDFEQSFFWKNGFSFRNLLFAGSAEKQTVSGSLVDALETQEWVFSDLYPVEDMLPQHPLTCEDLQVAIPSPSKSISHHHGRPHR